MKISTILDHIDSGHMALPEFQRGYVWNRDQVRGLFDSLYKRHPVGGLLVWATESKSAAHRGDSPIVAGIVKLLLDGQQRMTSLYGVVRGRVPKFFDGNARAFTDLRFHLDSEVFEFYQPIKMKDDPLWIDVTSLLYTGNSGLNNFATVLSGDPRTQARIGDYFMRLSRLLAILEIDLHIEEVSGDDKTIDVVVDIFNRVNSGGTKLSKGDLALAKICADWPEGRDTMKLKLREWAGHEYQFSLDWLLRSLNTVLTGEAKFQFLHSRTTTEIREALQNASRHVDTCLDLIAGRLGLDHDQVLFGRGAISVMARFLETRALGKLGTLDARERDKLLFWYAQAAMWGRFSGSTESFIDQDLAALEAGGLDALLEQLRLWHGGLFVEPGHFTGWSLGARFYPVLYMITRMGEARDWGSGLPLKANLLGRNRKLEVHHIFPKAQLYKSKYRKSEVNALANFCFLTKGTNLAISDRLPEDYFPEIEQAHPGALASQWIPIDPELWKIHRYPEFLESRKSLLAAEVNRRMEGLLHGEIQWLGHQASLSDTPETPRRKAVESTEEDILEKLNAWLADHELPLGKRGYELADPETGSSLAVLDLAWPIGLQQELSQPLAILLNEESEVLALANEAGYRCFTDLTLFHRHLVREGMTDGDSESVAIFLSRFGN